MLQLRVHSITYGAQGILLFDLRNPEGGALPAFEAGAHIDIRMDNGLLRSYSLINSPELRDRYVIAVLRHTHSRGGSAWLHDSARVGQSVAVSQPSNGFPLIQDAEHSVFIAGGIGITPILGMINQLNGSHRSWSLHYRFRHAESALLPEELTDASVASRVKISCGETADRRSFDMARIVGEAPPQSHLYCCGPPSLIEAFLETAKLRPSEYVHVEYFEAAENPSLDGGFMVRLARSGKTIAMLPGKSILAAVRDLGIEAPYSCQEGLCGECETRVIVGEPDHRDLFLTQAEKASGDKIMICCSGSKSPILELDL